MAETRYYLSSLDSVRFSIVRTCIVLESVRFDTEEDALVASIDPPVVGQDFGRAEDIDVVLLAARHEGQTVDPVSEFPCFVHIAIAKDPATAALTTPVHASDLNTSGWGELYRSADDAALHRFG